MQSRYGRSRLHNISAFHQVGTLRTWSSNCADPRQKSLTWCLQSPQMKIKKQPSSRLNGIWSATQALNNMCKFQLRLRPQENGVKSHAKLWPLFTLQLLLAGAPRKSYDFFWHPQQRSKPQIPAFISIGCLCLSIVTKHHFELPFCLALSLLPSTVPWCILKTTKEQARWPHKAHQRVEQFVAFVSRFWLDWSGLGSIWKVEWVWKINEPSWQGLNRTFKHWMY